MFAGSLRPGHVGIELDDSDAENSQVPAQAPQANVPDARLERPRAGKRQRVKSAEEEHEVALSRIKMKAEQLGDELAKAGTHSGSVPLAWAVLRPSEPPEVRRTRLGLAKRSSKAEEEKVDAVRRLRRRKPGSRPEVSNSNGGPQDGQISKAAALLCGLLGNDPSAEETSVALAKACLADGSRQRLIALAAALKSNEELRNAILSAGPAGAQSFAAQDPRDWAGSELQKKRQQWIQESLREAKVPSGHMAVCPECGGKAFVNTGRAGSGRAARLSKQYAHFKCTEKMCGKETHIQEG